MNLLKSLKIPVAASALILSASLLAGCGGVSEAQFAELDALTAEVRSLESEANTLKDERADARSRNFRNKSEAC